MPKPEEVSGRMDGGEFAQPVIERNRSEYSIRVNSYNFRSGRLARSNMMGVRTVMVAALETISVRKEHIIVRR